MGIFGVGIELKGLVPDKLYGETIYNDSLKVANATALKLKGDEKCDYVIWLSHLGYKFDNEADKISDTKLAENSKNIDLIIGGHTHTFLDKAVDAYNNLRYHLSIKISPAQFEHNLKELKIEDRIILSIFTELKQFGGNKNLNQLNLEL